jgi:hypothetical protein
MRRLRTGNRLLIAVLLALGVRVMIAGLTVATGLSLAVAGGLLLMSLLLTRHGRRLEPAARPAVDGGQPQPRPRPAPQTLSRQPRARRGRRRS